MGVVLLMCGPTTRLFVALLLIPFLRRVFGVSEFLRGCHSFCEKKEEIESEQKVFLIFNKLGTYSKKKK